MRKVKSIFICILIVCISITSSCCCKIKNKSIEALYRDVTFMQIVAEVKQHVNEVEYGIKNGKDLRSFYNISPILNDILLAYSYMEGVYIASSQYELLYSKGKSIESLTLGIPNKEALLEQKQLFVYYEDEDYYYLVSRINNPDRSIAGYVINCINKVAISNVIDDYIKQNGWQSAIIALELGIVLIWLIYRLKQSKYFLKKLTAIVAIGVMSILVLDTSIAAAKFYLLTNNICQQSANKIAQSLQTSVNEILDKNVPPTKVYDINAWLSENNDELEIISNLSVDKHLKIKADVERKYINMRLRDFTVSMGKLFFWCFIGIALLFLIQKIYYAMPKKKEPLPIEECDEMKEDDQQLVERQRAINLLERDFESNIMLLNLLKSNHYDELMIYNQSVRLRSTEEDYYLFALKQKADFKPLAEAIRKKLGVFFVNKEEFEPAVTEVFKKARIEKYCGFFCTREMYSEREDLMLPEGYHFAEIDLSWVDYILEKYDNEEFAKKSYIEECIKNAPALGMLYEGKKIAFMLQHRNGESGPLFVEGAFRNYNLATIMIHEYDRRLFEKQDRLYALIKEENIPSCKVAIKNGYKKAQQKVMWVYV